MTVTLAPARLLITRKADTVSQQTAFGYCREEQNEGKKKNGLIRENQPERKKHVALCKPYHNNAGAQNTEKKKK